MALMFFIIFYAIWPTLFRKKYIIFLVYADFFVFKKYFFSLFVNYIDPYGVLLGIANILGMSSE
jgi:hypothetical protein